MVFCLVHDDHDVVGGLVIDEELAIAVVHGTAGGVLYLLEKGVGIGTLAIVVAEYLQREETHDIYEHYNEGYGADDVFSVFEAVVFHGAYRLMLSMARTRARVRSRLPAVQRSQCCRWAKEKASRVKIVTQYMKSRIRA